MKKIVSLIPFFLFFHFSSFAASIISRVDKAKIFPGEAVRFSVVLKVEKEKHQSSSIEQIGPKVQLLRVTNEGEEKDQFEDEMVEMEKFVTVEADLVGSYVLPVINAKVGNEELSTGEIFLEVVSKESDGSKDLSDILDIKQIKRTSWVNRYFFWIVVAAFLLLSALFGGGVYCWRKYRKGKKEMILLTAEEKFHQNLHKLKEETSFLEEISGEFCFRCSFILREFIEEEYHLSATDQTYEELKVSLKSIDLEEKDKVLGMLKILDWAKYTDEKISLERWNQLLKDLFALKARPSPSIEELN